MRGCEWVVDARGCNAAPLASVDVLARLFEDMIGELALNPVRDPVWHRFPGHGGVTGVCLLAESHLAVHTFPEHGSLCLNLFCCTPRPEWDFAGELTRRLGATSVTVRRLERAYGPVEHGVAGDAVAGQAVAV